MLHHKHFIAAGAPVCLSTNSWSIISAAELSLAAPSELGAANGTAGAHVTACDAGFRVTISVNNRVAEAKRWTAPYCRGLDSIVVASFGPSDILVFNQLTKNVLGRISASLAKDQKYWQTVIFPLMAGTMGMVAGITPLHCACLVDEDYGIVLAGRSGAGKSTLSFALARMGFKFLSDDWTYFSRDGGSISAWGMPIPAKLLPDSTQFFPELRRFAPTTSLNGEAAFQADPVELCNTQRALRCDPRLVFIVESHDARPEGAECEFIPCDKERVCKWFEAGVQQLPPSLNHLRQEQLKTIELLADRECWILRQAGTPQRVATRLAEFCHSPRSSAGLKPETPTHMDARVQDMLRRFAPTPLHCQLQLEGIRIAFETNSDSLMQQLSHLQCPEIESAQISWRIVVEENSTERAVVGAFHIPNAGDDTSPLALFGDGSFLTFDKANHLGIGFLSESVLQEKRFTNKSLPAVMTRLQSAPAQTKRITSWKSAETYTGATR